MTEFRLRAAKPGGGIRQTLQNLRVPTATGPSGLVDIVIEDGSILAMHPSGTAPAAGEPIDFDGRFVLPGLVDHHVHFTQWAARSRRLDVAAAGSARELADLVAVHIAADPDDDELLVAVGFRDALWPDRPSVRLLDAVSGGRGVVVVSADLHCAWLNSAALARFGMTGADDDGLLREEDTFTLIRSLEAVPDDVADGWALDAAKRAAARGTTGIVDFEMAWNLERWRRRASAGHTMLRVEFGIYPSDLDRAIGLRLESGQIVPHTHGLVRVGSLKAISDGSLGTRTAWCVDPYPGATGSASYGAETVPLETLVDLMGRARRAGLRSAIHAIGDRANEAALDAFAATGASGSIEHAQLLRAADIHRIARLPVVASVQPEHANDDREIAEHYWPGRTDRAYPLRSILDAGGRLALGSDAPVAPLDPWVAMAAAVFRTRGGLEPWHPEQRIDLTEALAASTHNGKTALSAGDEADLVVTDADPYSADVDALRRMPVAATMLAGRFTHTRF